MSKNGSAYLLETTPVETGDGTPLGAVIIFKRSDHKEPRLWNCRIRVSAERRYLSRACKTHSETEARNVALEYYWEAKTLKKHKDTAKLWTRPFNKVVEEWLQDVEELVEVGIKSASQLRRYKTGIRCWKLYLDNTPVSRITQEEIDNFERWRQENRNREKPLDRTTIDADHMALSVCLQWAVKKRYLNGDDKPNAMLGLKKKEHGKKPGFTDDEWRKLQAFLRKWAQDPTLKKAARRGRYQFWQYCMILANSGMRVGEARHLKWKHVSIEHEGDETYVYFKVKGKTGEREVVTSSNCMMYLDAIKRRDKWLDDDDYIFVNKDGKHLASQDQLFRNMLIKAGLLYAANGKARSITGLRHLYATRQLVNNDVDVFRLAENMGTSVEQIKKHYADINPRVFRKHLTGIAVKVPIKDTLAKINRTSTCL